jgi:hypothetical protein
MEFERLAILKPEKVNLFFDFIDQGAYIWRAPSDSPPRESHVEPRARSEAGNFGH